jgi:hypothetical protein
MGHKCVKCKTQIQSVTANARKRLSFFEFALFDNALVRFAKTFNAIVKFAIAVWQLADDLVKTLRGISIGIATRELNFLPEAKSVIGHAPLHHAKLYLIKTPAAAQPSYLQ